MSDNFSLHALKRARLAAFVFSAWGFLAAFFVNDWAFAWPLVFFYGLLVLNTYFSVRVFATITPKKNISQQCFDAILSILVFLLPFYFDHALRFSVLATLLFIVATLKYISLVPLVGYSRLLYIKIRIEILGIALCFLAVVGVLLGYAYWTTVLWVSVFLAANIYMLWWEPYYRLELHNASH